MLELLRSLGESATEEQKRSMGAEQRLKDLTEALADTKQPA